jgi:hypothetical protein
MSISTRKAFEERSQKEISEEVLGIGIDPFVNSRIAWKQHILALIVSLVFLLPIVATQAEW